MLLIGHIFGLLGLLCISVDVAEFGVHVYMLYSTCATADGMVVLEGPYKANSAANFANGGKSFKHSR